MSKANQDSIGVIGAGAWGTALSCLLVEKNPFVQLWAFEEQTVKDINGNRENNVFLPGIQIPETVQPFLEIKKVVQDCKILVVVTPVQKTRFLIQKLKTVLTPEHRFVLAGKGIESSSSCLLSEMFEEELGTSENVAILSGPTFALEVAQKKPTAAVVASSNAKLVKQVQDLMHSPRFRLYRSNDVKGVQLAGAVKNVLAIAAGIAEGMQLGLNARAALICRGLAEMTRLGVKMGGQPETFSGMAGLGDLILTGTGSLSRNHELGVRISQGISPEDLFKNQLTVTEGAATSISLQKLSRDHQMEMPICEAVYQILHQGLAPRDALIQLLERQIPESEMRDWNQISSPT